MDITNAVLTHDFQRRGLNVMKQATKAARSHRCAGAAYINTEVTKTGIAVKDFSRIIVLLLS